MTQDVSKNDAEKLTFLRTDLSALKSEIARRSGLQERALVLYLAVVAFAVSRVAASDGVLPMIPAVWVSAWLATAFWTRENLEIARLSGVVRDRVATLAAAILGCHPGELVPSEVWPGDQDIDPRTRSLHTQFQWVCFLCLPTIPTFLGLWNRSSDYRQLYDLREPSAWLAIVTAVAAVHVICMLGANHARGRRLSG
jgi:hypothetical protein